MQQNVDLAAHTTLKVGGRAAYFVEVHNETELVAAIMYAKDHDLPWRVLGGGSNVLVPDAGFDGLLIKNLITKRDVVEADDQVLVTVGAGKVFDEIVAWTVQSGWWGLENLSHIPGSVGATPVQNVGAYGVEVRDIITAVRVLDTHDMQYKELTPEACTFGYRDSVFKDPSGKHYIITEVTYALSTQPNPKLTYRDLQQRFADTTPTLAEIREAVIAIRSKKFPDWSMVGTAGSFFKNPIIPETKYQELVSQYPELPGFVAGEGQIKVPLGWILDKVLHLKGAQEGAVGTYEGQALVIVNNGGATATDITTFAEAIVTKVKTKIGIDVEWEVTRW